MKKGCDAIEFDVRLTNDEIPIVFHDTTLERMTDLNLVISDSKWEQLANIDISIKHPFRNTDDTNVVKSGTYVETLRCHYLNGLCYARYDSDPSRPINYYIHSYLEVVHATYNSFYPVEESEELEINYRMIETVSSPDIRYLTPSQRKCHFDNEPLTTDVPVYGTSICYIICRHKLSLKLCGCKPFFYHFLGGKVCDIRGLLCLSKYANRIMQPPSQIGCKCPQPCELITYLPQIPQYTKWEHGYFDSRITFRWGLLPPTTKYRRDILFGFGDLIVSIGGTVALFLGISFISIIEIIFLFIESILKQYMDRDETPTKKLFVAVGKNNNIDME
ncbi:hypothetical protein NQ317_019741 [Molorchus minor]|uniref:GP-PDE domain-containing protein n=1 Tax=Molorchus minor TaxID=1323400 RepID=A0ABQ9K624_9CUCU|nr:hypothetical protein NQ317_019741 [Molorchus minor]